MRNISLLPIIKGNCVTFEIDNLLIRDPSIKNYDLFVEFGDGSFISFVIKDTNEETGRTTIYSKFNHVYKSEGTYAVKGCIKAIYSDDGDPLYPTIPTLEISSIGNEPPPPLVPSKLKLPKVRQGPSIIGSHMPKYNEQNVYVINYDHIQFKPGISNQLILFYNEKGKEYTQWNALTNPASSARHGNAVRFIRAGDTQQLLEIPDLRSDHPDWLQRINTYQQYVMFEVNGATGQYHNNLFIDLMGHKELESAIKDEKKTGKEHVKMDVCHLQTGTSLEIVNTFQYISEPLTRFHDPNYIYVSPEFVRPVDIPTTIWTYDLSISNDGKGTASDVRTHVVLDTNFFDLTTITHVETTPFRYDRLELEKDGVSIYWDSIALPGINFPDDNKLTIRFSIQPKARYVLPDKLSAHAIVDMYSGSIKETTQTEEVAITEILDSERTRRLHIEDILSDSGDSQRTV